MLIVHIIVVNKVLLVWFSHPFVSLKETEGCTRMAGYDDKLFLK